MQEHIATFFSHFGAMSFKKHCDTAGFPARIMPVPRSLSSSCGTCVKFAGDLEKTLEWKNDEIEQIVRIEDDGSYVCCWSE